MTENTPRSGNPADDKTLTGLMKMTVQKAMQGMDSMMPVEVVKYDRATNRATVKHLIQMQGTNGDKVDRAQIASVRVQQFGNAKFSISLPIKPGDKGWLKAADRDISLFQQDINKADAPNTERMHSFQDGVFMPDAMGAGDAPAGQGDKTVIGSVTGGFYFSFDDDGCELKIGPVTFTVTAGGVDITGGTVTHNGKNIGSTHTHGGVIPGAANTDVPNA